MNSLGLNCMYILFGILNLLNFKKILEPRCIFV